MGWRDTIRKKEVPSWRSTITAKPVEPTQSEALVRGAGQGATLGFMDELSGLGGALGDQLGRIGVDEVEATHPETQAKIEEIKAPSFGETYRQSRDEERGANAASEKAHPKTFFASQLTGGLANPVSRLGSGLGGAAAMGSLYGVGGSDADLTQGEFKKSAKDIGIGAGAGALGYGVAQAIPYVAKGLGKLGKKALTVMGPSDEAISERLAGRAQSSASSYPKLAEKMGGSLKKLEGQIQAADKEASQLLSTEANIPKAYASQVLDEAYNTLKKSHGQTAEVDEPIVAILDKLKRDVSKYGDTISQKDLKEIIQTSDHYIKWDKDSERLNNILKGIRHNFDQTLKFQNPEYKKSMVPVAVKMRILANVRKQFNFEHVPTEGLTPTDTTANKLAHSLSENKFMTQKNLGLLERQTGDDYLKGVKDYNLSKQFEVPVGKTEKSTRRTMAGAGAGSLLGSAFGPMGAAVGGALGAGAGSLADRYGGKWVGSFLDGLVKAGNSEALGKFAPIVREAAKKGPQALAVTGALLSKDEDFKKLLDSLGGR